MTRLADLGVADAAMAVREGRITATELTEDCLRRVSETDAQVQAWAFLDPEHAMRQAQAADEHRMAGRSIGPLHGVPIGIKDIFDTSDYPTEFGSRAVGGAYAAARCGRCRAPACGRRHHSRQDGDDRVRLLPSRQDAEPARSGAHAGWIVEWLGGSRCSGHGSCRHRLADQRVGDPPSVVLRCRRLQAHARPDPAIGRAAALPRARSCWRLRAIRHRCSAACRRAHRLR